MLHFDRQMWCDGVHLPTVIQFWCPCFEGKSMHPRSGMFTVIGLKQSRTCHSQVTGTGSSTYSYVIIIWHVVRSSSRIILSTPKTGYRTSVSPSNVVIPRDSCVPFFLSVIDIHDLRRFLGIYPKASSRKSPLFCRLCDLAGSLLTRNVFEKLLAWHGAKTYNSSSAKGLVSVVAV